MRRIGGICRSPVVADENTPGGAFSFAIHEKQGSRFIFSAVVIAAAFNIKYYVFNIRFHDYPNEQRLNLGYFTPDRMVLIRL